MRTWTLSFRLLFLPLCLAGCASTSATRSGGVPKIRTVASIGDKTLPIVSGTPGSTVVAERVAPELRVGTNGRVSGRVVDSEGQPVPNAQVRLAVGGARGGRMHRATTDRSGAFTLRGLQPREPYTVIAELNDERGHLTGRSDVRAPDTDVRITLSSPDVEAPGSSTLVSSISDRSEREEPAVEAAEPALVNEEDLLPWTGRSAAAGIQIEPTSGGDDRFPSDAGSKLAARDSSVVASHESTSKIDPTAAPVDTEMHGTGSASEVLPYDDDGVNPLPPALEREAPPEPPAVDEPNRDTPIEEGPAPAIREEQASVPPREGSGRPMRPAAESASEPIPGAFVVAPEEAVVPTPAPRSTPEPARQGSPVRQRPTWREVASRSPVPEVLEGSGAPEAEPVVNLSETKEAARPRLKARTPRVRIASKEEESETFCRYDAKNRRIEDFLLPDLEGKPVHFRDLDADLVLIDFWGTWCEPCVDSVPHLVELQKRLGPGRLKVVGIACEKGPADRRAAKVVKTAERLGINYPLLLSSTEDHCPLQEALHIQAYPTMILVDRNGQILWRDQGSTPISLARLDRVIAASTGENSEVVRR